MKTRRFFAAAGIIAICTVISAFFAACPRGEPDSPPPPTEYGISISSALLGGAGYGVSASKTTAPAGAEITLTITTDADHELVSIRVKNGANVTIPAGTGAARTFVMPAEAVEIIGSFGLASDPHYTVTTVVDSNFPGGTVTASPLTALSGQDVFLTVAPAATKKIAFVSAAADDLTTIPVEEITGARLFTMPAQGVTVTAGFVDENAQPHGITINVQHASLTASPAGSLFANTPVTVTLNDIEAGYRYAGTFSVTGTNTGNPVPITTVPGAAGPGTYTWTFTMPPDSAIDAGSVITIYAEIEAIPTYAVTQRVVVLDAAGQPTTLTGGGGGAFSIDKTSPYAEETVTVTLTVTDTENYRYKNNSITVKGSGPGSALDLTASLVPDGTLQWKFDIPAEATAEPVEVYAEIEPIPAHTVTVNLTLTDISLSDHANGTLNSDKGTGASYSVMEGKTVTFTLTVADPDNYRYKPASFAVTKSGSVPVTVTPAGANQWSFVMPTEPVTVSAEIEPIPTYNLNIGTVTGGAITAAVTTPAPGTGIIGTPSGGVYQVRAGTAITLTAAPVTAVPVVSGTDGTTGVNGKTWKSGTPGSTGVTLSPVTADVNKWTFTMPESAVGVTPVFTELNNYEIYKGGLHEGITVGKSTGWHFPNKGTDTEKWISFDAAVTGGGHNGNAKVIRISSMPGDFPQGFALGANINLTGVKALSLWAKAGSEAGTRVQWMGFGGNEVGIGDGNVKAVVYGETNFLVPGTWTHYIIPVPAEVTASVIRSFFIGLNDQPADLYLDDIEYIKDGVSIDSIEIPESSSIAFPLAGYNAAALAGSLGYSVTWKHTDNTTAKLINQVTQGGTFDFSDWPVVLEYGVEGAATITGGSIIPNALAALFKLYLKIGAVESNRMDCQAATRAFLVIDDFETCVTGNFGGGNTALGYREFGPGTWTGVNGDNDPNLRITGKSGRLYESKDGRSGRHFAAAKDISGCTTILIDVKSRVALTADDRYFLELGNGGDPGSINGDRTWYGAAFTIAADNTVETKTLNLASFAFVGVGGGTGGSPAAPFDPSAVTGWRVWIYTDAANPVRDIIIDNIIAE